MAPQQPPAAQDDNMTDDEPAMLAQDDALEEIADDGDVAMDSQEDDNDEGEEMGTIENDSVAYMDVHKSSVFCIAAHPLRPSLVATGGSEGEDDGAVGMGYVTETGFLPDPPPQPVLPASFGSDPVSTHQPHAPVQLDPIYALRGHVDSVNAIAFTQPRGEYLLTGGLDGRLRAWAVTLPPSPPAAAASASASATFKLVGEAQEVKEINFIVPCPSTTQPNTIALGASDGSVWVYTVGDGGLDIVQSYFTHASSVTAGAWTPDGNLLASVDEDGSLYVWDIFGVAAARGLAGFNGGTSVVALTAADARFAVDGGFYSVAVDPKGSCVAAGGATGQIKVVSLPKLSAPMRGGKKSQAGQIIATLSTQSAGVETLSFAPEPLTMLAAGSVDGSIAVFDTSRQYALRRHLVDAHEDEAVVKVDWVKGQQWFLTSCGADGVLRRWDLRAGSGPDSSGAVAAKQWKGHRGDGEKCGVMGFVQTDDGNRVVTVGDDGVVLVFYA